MTAKRKRALLAVLMVALLSAGAVTVIRLTDTVSRTFLTAHFDNSNGVFRGDNVMILGVPVGEITEIEPRPDGATITFWVDSKYNVPADAKAVIVLPQLITARAIELTPVYSGGPTLGDGAVIPRDRTVVPVEWDDLRTQLQKLADALRPTESGGVSPLGSLINTAADNLRGQGASIRDTIIKLSQTLSALGDHSGDIFGTLRNLATLVSALHDSSDVLRQLNENLTEATHLLANDQDEVGQLVDNLNSASTQVRTFVADNQEAVGTATDKLTSISQAMVDSLDDIKQTLHVAPTAFQNFINIYQPAQATFSGALALNNFANPITFLCGAIQAASRLGAEQSAKLCVQYLAPIIKNRQFNFPPIGLNPIVGAQTRPNEITYSEDWMRPDHRPTPAPVAPPPAGAAMAPNSAPLPAEAPVATNPAAGLPGLMVPPGAGS
ncbi:MCE family protein [Mycobacterium sp. 236(2023)]|uniref:MCE family protein n=1 Tax=Mycobacterium sp. 236(2023) TaxID=3038163 RepID=UPI0024158981|nr:MCE family protein [Mycobacterium sp. 236(2023)]MDG4668063.1 MCE family protein [Mycobacterium sp. 236(2023)]